MKDLSLLNEDTAVAALAKVYANVFSSVYAAAMNRVGLERSRDRLINEASEAARYACSDFAQVLEDARLTEGK